MLDTLQIQNISDDVRQTDSIGRATGGTAGTGASPMEASSQSGEEGRRTNGSPCDDRQELPRRRRRLGNACRMRSRLAVWRRWKEGGAGAGSAEAEFPCRRNASSR